MSHRQRIGPDSPWAAYPGDQIHVYGKGWMTVSKTGKSILWDDYHPPTKREIDRENRWRAKRNAYFKTAEGQAYLAKTDKMIDDLFARAGTSRAEVFKTIFDVISNAPSMFPQTQESDDKPPLGWLRC